MTEHPERSKHRHHNQCFRRKLQKSFCWKYIHYLKQSNFQTLGSVFILITSVLLFRINTFSLLYRKAEYKVRDYLHGGGVPCKIRNRSSPPQVCRSNTCGKQLFLLWSLASMLPLNSGSPINTNYRRAFQM